VVFRIRCVEVTLIICYTNIWRINNRHIETSILVYVLGCYQYVGFVILYIWTPIPLAALSKAWVYGLSLAGITGWNPAGDTDVSLLWVLSVVFATGRSAVQRSPTDCGVSNRVWSRNLNPKEALAF